jgi:hypothetical protein
MYDAAAERVALVDLGMYRPGPYILQADRQHGSRRFMAPEEFVRGSVIDERTTVFTLGRTARVLLGEPGQWRASGALESVTAQARPPTRATGSPASPTSPRRGLTAPRRVARVSTKERGRTT